MPLKWAILKNFQIRVTLMNWWSVDVIKILIMMTKPQNIAVACQLLEISGMQQ